MKKEIKKIVTEKYSEEALMEAIMPEFLKENTSVFASIKKILGISEKLTANDIAKFRLLNEMLLWVLPLLVSKKVILDKEIIKLVADTSSNIETILKYEKAMNNPSVILLTKSQISIIDFLMSFLISVCASTSKYKPESKEGLLSLKDIIKEIDTVDADTRKIIDEILGTIIDGLRNNLEFSKVLMNDKAKLEEDFGTTIAIGGIIVSSALLFKVLRWYYVEKWKPEPIKSESLLDGKDIKSGVATASKESWAKFKNLFRVVKRDTIAKSDLEVKEVIKKAEKTDSGDSLI